MGSNPAVNKKYFHLKFLFICFTLPQLYIYEMCRFLLRTIFSLQVLNKLKNLGSSHKNIQAISDWVIFR